MFGNSRMVIMNDRFDRCFRRLSNEEKEQLWWVRRYVLLKGHVCEPMIMWKFKIGYRQAKKYLDVLETGAEIKTTRFGWRKLSDPLISMFFLQKEMENDTDYSRWHTKIVFYD